VLHTDGWRGYDGLVDLGFDKHFRVSHWSVCLQRFRSVRKWSGPHKPAG